MINPFDDLCDWLLDQTLSDHDMSTTLKALTKKLIEIDVPLDRVSISRSLLHPTIGLFDMVWEREDDHVTITKIPRHLVLDNMNLNTPFVDLAKGKVTRVFADLTDPEEVARYDNFPGLAAAGITAYVAFARVFGLKHSLYFPIEADFRGACVSVATKHPDGFTTEDLRGMTRLMPALCACLRVDSERSLAEEILDIYLGRVSGKKILGGQIELGDGQNLKCAIFYSDLRNSLGLSQQLERRAYLDTLNAYFDCTATSVQEHGGEVLKFIGDGILAIFPFDDDENSRPEMCAAALASAQDAFVRAKRLSTQRQNEGLPDIEFGVALHLGEVIYGNVGTQHRLDFTATGPAVGLASRIEGLTRELDYSILGTREFATQIEHQGDDLGPHDIRGFDTPISLVGFPIG
jgi:adenylate cyclase